MFGHTLALYLKVETQCHLIWKICNLFLVKMVGVLYDYQAIWKLPKGEKIKIE